MPLLIDLKAAIENLRITLQNLSEDLKRFEGLAEEHFTIATKRSVDLNNLEKEINKEKAAE